MRCCLAQVPLTTAAVESFAVRSLARPVTVVSDGLKCFAVLGDLGIVHRSIVTGSASATLLQCTAVNTLLGSLKTALNDTYHALNFAKYTHLCLGAVHSSSFAVSICKPSSGACLRPLFPSHLGCGAAFV